LLGEFVKPLTEKMIFAASSLQGMCAKTTGHVAKTGYDQNLSHLSIGLFRVQAAKLQLAKRKSGVAVSSERKQLK
jgi:hypothetical protein